MTKESIKSEIDLGSQERLRDPIVKRLFQIYTELGLLDSAAELLEYQDPIHREPVIHILTTHVTKEKPVFIYGLANNSTQEESAKKGVAVATDILWTLSLIYDDIVDNDSQRAGNTAAWVKYGTEIAMASAQSGVASVKRYLSDLIGDHAENMVDKYLAEALSSVATQKELGLGCSVAEVIHNYDQRMCFHVNLPIDLLYPERSEQRRTAFEALYEVNLAGQMLNDLKDMSSEYGWIRSGFTDIKSGIVTFPMAFLWSNFDDDQQSLISDCFGKQELTEDQTKMLAACFADDKLELIKEEIRRHYQKSREAFAAVCSTEVNQLASEWIDAKMNQLDRLKI